MMPLFFFFDFFKAFDTVEHNFIFKALVNFGFGNNFVLLKLYTMILIAVFLFPMALLQYFMLAEVFDRDVPFLLFSFYSLQNY